MNGTVTCPILRIDSEEDFVQAFQTRGCDAANLYPFSQSGLFGNDYTELSLTRAMHNAPRFGNTRDISSYVNGSEANEYYFGVRAMAILCWCFFLAWTLILLHARFTRRGQGYFGWVSGLTLSEQKEFEIQYFRPSWCGRLFHYRRRRQTSSDESADAASSSMTSSWLTSGRSSQQPVFEDVFRDEYMTKMEQHVWNKRVRGFQRSMSWIRLVVGFAVLGMITCSILVHLIGFPELNSTMNALQVDLPKLRGVIEDAQTSAHEIAVSIQDSDKARQDVVNYFRDRCSGTSISGVNRDAMLQLNATLANASLVTPSYILDLNQSFYNLSRSVELANEGMEYVGVIWEYVIGGLFILMDACGVCFLVGTILAWRRQQPPWLVSLNTRRILPLFLTILMAVYLFSTYTLIYSEILSDTCIESPDVQVNRIIEPHEELEDVVDWYLGGCSEQVRPDFLSEALRWTVDSVEEIESAIRLATRLFFISTSGMCSRETTSSELLLRLSEKLNNLLRLSYNFTTDLECERFYPTYSHLVHTTACNTGIEGLTKTFFTTFPFVICAMVIVTLRVAWKDDWYDDSNRSVDDEQKSDEAVTSVGELA